MGEVRAIRGVRWQCIDCGQHEIGRLVTSEDFALIPDECPLCEGTAVNIHFKFDDGDEVVITRPGKANAQSSGIQSDVES